MSSSDSKTTTVTATVRSGSCLCKSIKLEITGDPFTFRICHCANCQKSTGSAFTSSVFFSREKVQVLEGEEHLKFYRDNDTKSGFALDRYFCIHCGSNIFLQSNQEAGNDIRIVALGLVDGPTDWIPKTELWPHNRHHWIKEIKVRNPSPKL